MTQCNWFLHLTVYLKKMFFVDDLSIVPCASTQGTLSPHHVTDDKSTGGLTKPFCPLLHWTERDQTDSESEGWKSLFSLCGSIKHFHLDLHLREKGYMCTL